MAKITLRDVTVDIPIITPNNRSLKNNIISAATGGQIKASNSGKTIIRAIDGLTLDIAHGARVGVVGHNGAGKSTLLRVIAGLYEPTAGSITVEGSIASMFDIGFGMDPDATGWENITLRGLLLGYSLKEIRSRLDQIGAMTGLGEFLDMPLRAYSSGMATRLAFAVSTSITPEVLLIDEGIGAGDAAFLAQAKEQMQRFIGHAGLLVMASHSDELLAEWCNLGLWMEHGRMRSFGPIDQVITEYHANIGSDALSSQTDETGAP